MEDLLVFAAAVVLIVLGARGTYVGVWNKIFPNMPLQGGTPTQTPQTIDLASAVQSAANAVNQAANNPANNPVAAGQKAGTAARKKVQSILSGGSNMTSSSKQAAHTVPAKGGAYPVESIGTTKQEVLSTGIPSWWPSWLPWPGTLINYYPGEGQTGQSINNPFAP